MSGQQLSDRPRSSLHPDDVYSILSPFGALVSLIEESAETSIATTDVVTIGRALYENAMAKVKELSEGSGPG
uniref:Uncharacterized protein n=1 Tax=Desulfovibrio sp. U5L TaxID=596152 RepID=I2PWM1_9BACT